MITSLDQLNPDGSYTYADYLLWQLQERIELIRGKIVRMSPAPSRRHQEAASNLHGMMWAHFKGKPCKVFTAPFDVRLPRKAQPGDKAYTVVQPDLCVVCDPAKLDDRGCEGAPDLVVEILSPGNTRREMREKFEVYEESGVREYWMVHLGDKTVQVFVLHEADGRFHGIKPFVDGDLMPAQIFPDLRIDLAEVFAT
jgi:Uma2 family endonuclease